MERILQALVNRRFRLYPFEIQPEVYPSLVKFCQDVDEADRRHISLVSESP